MKVARPPSNSTPVAAHPLSSLRTAPLLTIPLLGGGLALLLTVVTTTPRARLNILQATAIIFYLTVFLKRAAPGKIFRQAHEYSAPRLMWLGLLLATLTYSFTLNSWFLGDDYPLLRLNEQPLLMNLNEWFTVGQAKTFLRPIGFLSLALDDFLFGQWPAGFHAVNLLLHMLCVWAIYRIGLALMMTPATAATAAMLFAVMPIHAEAVAWMGARFDLLATVLGLWALERYLAWRRGRAESGADGYGVLTGCAALITLAMLSKESAYVFPLMIAALEILAPAAPPQLRLRNWLTVAGFAALAGGLILYRWAVLGGVGGYHSAALPAGAAVAAPAVWDLGLHTLLGVFVRAPAQMLLGLNWFATNALIAPVGVPLLAPLVVASLTGGLLMAIALFRHPAGNRPLLALFAAWMVLPVLPAHFIALVGAGLTGARVYYLGSAGLALLLAVVCSELSGNMASAPGRAWSPQTVACALALLFSVGLAHNLRAWAHAGRQSREFVVGLREIAPSPPEGSVIEFHDLPGHIEGAPFFSVGLSDAVALAYGRNDVAAVACASPVPCADRAAYHTVITLRWAGTPGQVLEQAP